MNRNVELRLTFAQEQHSSKNRRKVMSIATQAFGSTGHMSTRTIFGAASLGSVTQKDADRTLEVLQRYGVNHIDVAASYGDAELRIATWLAQNRTQFIAATQTGARTAQEVTEKL